MPAKYFTVEEANAILPKIEPILRNIADRRSKIIRSKEEIIEMLELGYIDVGGKVASELANDFIAIEKMIGRIQGYGCAIKDLNTGLIDFLSIRNEREVYLCWRFGEPQVEYFHELHTGFAGRKPLHND
jgi:hypothetical protein